MVCAAPHHKNGTPRIFGQVLSLDVLPGEVRVKYCPVKNFTYQAGFSSGVVDGRTP